MPDRETEVKVRVSDLAEARLRLKRAGLALAHSRAFEDNVLFDTPDRILRKARSILRLRHYGRQWIVTFKGTPTIDSLYKSRVEIEMEVSEHRQIRKIFEALGFRPVFRYQKYRTHYVPADAKRSGRAGIKNEVALDETPIGVFLEIEGTRRSIDEIAKRLGFSHSDFITKSYGALYLEECGRRGVTPRDMLFPKPPLGGSKDRARGGKLGPR